MSHDAVHLGMFLTRDIVVPAENIVSGTVLVGAKVVRPGLAANAKPAALAALGILGLQRLDKFL